MFHFDIDDPNLGLRSVVETMKSQGIKSDSRNGEVWRLPRPAVLQYDNPRRRLLDDPVRDANPFFHLFEAIWMLGGRCELKPLLLFNSQMAQYSDDGLNLRGTAYGHRWRRMWGDQLTTAIEKFRANIDERRVVISMWDPAEHDIPDGKDFACNLQVLFSTRPSDWGETGRVLDMTVTNRSNDLIYGAMGSNVFHFSLLHEYMALLTGLSLGTYYQFSNNLHVYVDNPVAKRVWDNSDKIEPSTLGADYSLQTYGLPLDMEVMSRFVLNHDDEVPKGYLTQIVRPMVEAYKIYKMGSRLGFKTDLDKRIDVAVELCGVVDSPLGANGIAWLERRRKK